MVSETTLADEQAAVTAVAVKSLLTAKVFDFRLYIWLPHRPAPSLYKDRQIPLLSKDVQGLLDRGVRVLYVANDELAAYQAHLQQNVLNNNQLPLSERFEILSRTAKGLLKESFHSYSSREILRTSAALSEQISHMVCDSEGALGDFFNVMTHDYSAFTHSLNVGAMSMLLARQLGFSQEEELTEIGQGALLHDIGKFHPAQPGSASPADEPEASLSKEHPLLGFKKLANSSLSNGQLMMIYQHHERCNGSGFPVGLVGPEIHPYARLCAVANTLTKYMSAEPGKRGRMPGREAIQFLRVQGGRLLDQEMVECWIAAIGAERQSS